MTPFLKRGFLLGVLGVLGRAARQGCRARNANTRWFFNTNLGGRVTASHVESSRVVSSNCTPADRACCAENPHALPPSSQQKPKRSPAAGNSSIADIVVGCCSYLLASRLSVSRLQYTSAFPFVSSLLRDLLEGLCPPRPSHHPPPILLCPRLCLSEPCPSSISILISIPLPGPCVIGSLFFCPCPPFNLLFAKLWRARFSLRQRSTQSCGHATLAPIYPHSRLL